MEIFGLGSHPWKSIFVRETLQDPDPQQLRTNLHLLPMVPMDDFILLGGELCTAYIQPEKFHFSQHAERWL